MRKYWFGLMLAHLAGLTARAPAQEVIAATRPEQPVATSAPNPIMPIVNDMQLSKPGTGVVVALNR